jgi:phasin
MAKNPAEQFDIPPEVGALAEKGVEQARKAVEGFMAVAQRTISTFEGRAESARKNARDVGQRAIVFAERNIADSFDFAARLVRARDVNEMLQLQGEYIRTQMQTLADQAKELGNQTSKIAGEASGTKSADTTKSAV